MRSLRAPVLVCAALAILGPGRAGGEEPVRKKVLVIGIDGCRPDALRKAKTPYLQMLIRHGAFSDRAQTGDITVSGPGWSSILTGVWRHKHGVRDNRFDGADFASFPHFIRRLKQARPDAYAASVVHWGPINRHILKDADLALTLYHDAHVADRAERVLAEGDPDVLFAHFEDVDEAGHTHGFDPDLHTYIEAIERTDAHVGRLLRAVHDRRTFAREDWLVVVATDHGGSGKSHGKDIPEHRTVFVIVSGPSAGRGVIEPAPAVVDVAATALAHLGVPIDPRWHLDGRPIGLRDESILTVRHVPRPASRKPAAPVTSDLFFARGTSLLLPAGLRGMAMGERP